MQLEPKDLYEKLEFDKVLELTERECYGLEGKQYIRNLGFDTQKELLEPKLKAVSEYKLSIEESDRIPISTYPEIDEDLKVLAVENYVLGEESLQRINVILRMMQEILAFFNATRQEIYPTLYSFLKDTTLDKELVEAIDQVIDEKGAIRPDASPELSRIRRSIGGKQRELEKRFRTIINEYKKRGWLSDNVESFRNGRRVLSVPSEHKRKIKGIIHDESTTGKTAFIEPEAIIDINNDIFDLQTEERREIYRILKELSAMLRPFVPHIWEYLSRIARFDMIQAKAQIAIKLNANLPQINQKSGLGIIKGFHPLLFLKNQQINKKTVPFDLKLFNGNRVLMLSGPNAGGKSITMKSVGLLQLMLQSGMLIPVDEESEMGLFNKLFADIGDQQSLEDDLSTYSSRLENMRSFLQHADDQTMILIDEFGSGTDPKIGGAIAEAIMEEFNKQKVHGLITTHYSNLKLYAFQAKGIINGAMTFDKEGLSPTYQLKIGRPGSSFAFEIASKSGLGKNVLNYAKKKTGKNEKAIDELLIDLQRERKELEERLEEMSVREKKLERLIKNYENLYRDFEFRRKKLKLEAKEQSMQKVANDNKAFEKLIRELKEEKNLEKAKKAAAEVRDKRSQLHEDVTDLREELYYKPLKDGSYKEKPIVAGDFVRLRTGGAAGKVESIRKGKVIVLMGLMKMTANIEDLQHANAPLDIRSTPSVQTNTVNDHIKFESKIDLRGLSKEDALRLLEGFVDKALVSSATNLRIVHGKGTGVLREAVKRKLKEYKSVESFWHPPHEEGGDGVTIVAL